MSGGTFLINADDPQRRAVVLSVTDVTAQRELNERLSHQARHDHLTGLPNRAYILELLDDALCREDDGRVAALYYIDLNGLKEINDSLGHHAGDVAIQRVAHRLRSSLGPADIAGRVGGDEFVAVLRTPCTRSDLDKVANAIHAAVSQPLVTDDGVQRISASIGIVIVGDSEPRSAVQLMRDADHAMYRAKTMGHGRSCFFGEA
jgi:ribose transport system permease protein